MQRMKLLGVLLVTLIAATGAFADEVILVANSHAGTVSVIDANSHRKRCDLDVVPDLEARRAEWGVIHKLVNWYTDFTFADDIALSPDKRTLYVSRGSVSDVVAFDVATNRLLWRTPVKGFRSDHIAVAPDGRHLFVSAISRSEVEIIDLERHETVGHIPTGSQPHGLSLSPDGGRLYIGEKRGRKITVADAHDFRVVNEIPFEEGVRPFVIAPDGKALYAQLSDFHGFIHYNLQSNKIERRVELPTTAKSDSYHGRYPKRAAHHGIALSEDERHLCIAGTASDYVALVSRTDMKTEALISVGEQPNWAINSLDGKYCYVSSRGSDTVSIISYEEKREVRRIAVGSYPQRMVTADLADVCGE